MAKIEVGKQYVWNHVHGEPHPNNGKVVKVLSQEDDLWVTQVVPTDENGIPDGFELWALESELTPVEPETVLDATVEEFAANVGQNLRVVALSLAVQWLSSPESSDKHVETVADDFYEWLTKEEN